MKRCAIGLCVVLPNSTHRLMDSCRCVLPSARFAFFSQKPVLKTVYRGDSEHIRTTLRTPHRRAGSHVCTKRSGSGIVGRVGFCREIHALHKGSPQSSRRMGAATAQFNLLSHASGASEGSPQTNSTTITVTLSRIFRPIAWVGEGRKTQGTPRGDCLWRVVHGSPRRRVLSPRQRRCRSGRGRNRPDGGCRLRSARRRGRRSRARGSGSSGRE